MVLVCGGAGYIGSHTVKALSEAGHRVVVLDNLSTGHAQAIRDVTLVEGDVRDTDLVESTLRRYGVTDVVHFAGLLSVEESIREPARYYKQNVLGSLSLLDAMVTTGVQRFVFSSSCSIYGVPVSSPINETHPTEPINVYGESKLLVERALGHYGRAYGLRSISLRYFNAAGADPGGELGEDHDPEVHLIPCAIRAARNGLSLKVYGNDYETADGTCERDYVHVSDLAAAHICALDALATGSAAVRAYNLGTGQTHSVREVIGSVEKASGCQVKTEETERRPGDPPVLCASAERIDRELSWRPIYSNLDDIVETAWRWHIKHPGGFER